jgi:2-iminoacetate synthase
VTSRAFRLDPSVVQELVAAGRTQAEDARGIAALVERARRGAGLAPGELAALWFAPSLEGEALYQIALAARAARPAPLETFAPLYLTNTCDAECRMCGMRRDNGALERETADERAIVDQLRTLARRGMYGVALLTGEYRAERRAWAIALTNRALRATQAMGFRHVLVNIGSLEDDELPALLDGIARRNDGTLAAKVTMCTFQETYSVERYRRFMGDDPANPRADFARRLANFDRARRAGFRVANPGVLVGLNPDLVFEMVALALHVDHLLQAGMEVYLSLPRLRRVAGQRSEPGVPDEPFIRLVSLLSLGLPTCKIVLTTRESSEMQQKLVSLVTVLSAGSSAVAPYTESGARFPLSSSQFEVIDQRPFEEILADRRPDLSPIVNYEPRDTV